MQTQTNQASYENAIQHYNKAIRELPTFAQAYNYRGVAYANLGKIDRAIEDFNAAIRLKTNYAEAYSNRGGVYRLKGAMIAPSKIATQP